MWTRDARVTVPVFGSVAVFGMVTKTCNYEKYALTIVSTHIFFNRDILICSSYTKYHIISLHIFKNIKQCTEFNMFRQICCQPIVRQVSLLREPEHLNNECVVFMKDSMAADFILARLSF